MKLKDFVNKKINSRNNQVSFDVRKLKLSEFDIDINDLMNTDVSKSITKFKHGEF